jgi:hypothetical protein
MKSLKILLLSVFLVAASNSIRAQGWGIRAGANFSDISGSGFDTEAKTGFYAGVFKEIPVIKDLLFVQPEIQYSQEGFETSTKDFKIDYITVPLMAKIYVLKLLSFETGPQFGFPISDNIDFADTEGFVTTWGFGMSINLPFRLSINGRYVTGLSDSLESFESKGQVFQVGAAFRF